MCRLQILPAHIQYLIHYPASNQPTLVRVSQYCTGIAFLQIVYELLSGRTRMEVSGQARRWTLTSPDEEDAITLISTTNMEG